MSSFVVENFVIAFNPNSRKDNTSQEVPNFAHLPIPFRIFFSEQGLSPTESVVIAGPDPAKFMHDVGGLPPNPPGLDTIPKLVCDRFTSIKKIIVLEIDAGAIFALHLLTATVLCQINHIKAASLPALRGSYT